MILAELSQRHNSGNRVTIPSTLLITTHKRSQRVSLKPNSIPNHITHEKQRGQQPVLELSVSSPSANMQKVKETLLSVS